MVPSNNKYSNYDDYNAHGSIIQEMRLTSRVYSFPVVSITQNSKESENTMQELTNRLVGDSYKKVRYSDYIIMVRMRRDLELLSSQVKSDVLEHHENQDNMNISDMLGQYLNSVVSFEAHITKAKEGRKGDKKFHIFSGDNLKIYNKLNEYYKDIPSLKSNSAWLDNQINLLGMNSMQNTVQDPKQFELNLL